MLLLEFALVMAAATTTAAAGSLTPSVTAEDPEFEEREDLGVGLSKSRLWALWYEMKA